MRQTRGEEKNNESKHRNDIKATRSRRLHSIQSDCSFSAARRPPSTSPFCFSSSFAFVHSSRWLIKTFTVRRFPVRHSFSLKPKQRLFVFYSLPFAFARFVIYLHLLRIPLLYREQAKINLLLSPFAVRRFHCRLPAFIRFICSPAFAVFPRSPLPCFALLVLAQQKKSVPLSSSSAATRQTAHNRKFSITSYSISAAITIAPRGRRGTRTRRIAHSHSDGIALPQTEDRSKVFSCPPINFQR